MCSIGGHGRHIGRQSTDISVDYRSAIDRLSVDSRPIYRPMYRPMCRPRPPIVHMIQRDLLLGAPHSITL